MGIKASNVSSSSLVFVCSGRRGGNQAGDQHAEEVLAPQKHRYLLWSLHQEESSRPRRPALGETMAYYTVITTSAVIL